MADEESPKNDIPMAAKVAVIIFCAVPTASLLVLGVVGIVGVCWKATVAIAHWAF